MSNIAKILIRAVDAIKCGNFGLISFAKDTAKREMKLYVHPLVWVNI